MRMAIREGAWDCPSCGHRGNRGPRKFCSGCGAPRGEGVAFYLPDEAPEVTDAAEIARAQPGPDWICSHCEGDNPADAPFCSGCGAPRDGARRREVIEHRFDAPPAVPSPPPSSETPLHPPSPLRKGCYAGGCLALALLFLFALLTQVPSSPHRETPAAALEAEAPRQVELTVAEVSWERSIGVEVLRTRTEDAWEGEVPESARLLSSSREVHHQEKIQVRTETRVRTWTERVQAGTEKVRDGSDRVQVGSERVKVGVRDLGNGYFEDIYEDRPVYEDRPRYEERPVYREVERHESHEEPVYGDKPVYRRRHRYEIDRWETVRTAESAGKDGSPAWPEVRLGPGEREGTRSATYTVVLREPSGGAFPYRPPGEDEWRGFAVGDTYAATLSPRGELLRVGERLTKAPGPGAGTDLATDAAPEPSVPPA
jgi:hypothetical protein